MKRNKAKQGKVVRVPGALREDDGLRFLCQRSARGAVHTKSQTTEVTPSLRKRAPLFLKNPQLGKNQVRLTQRVQEQGIMLTSCGVCCPEIPGLFS